MANHSRAQRVADQIQRDIAALIQFEVDDPRIGIVSVTGVDVSADLAHAKVYVTSLGQAEAIQGQAEAIQGQAEAAQGQYQREPSEAAERASRESTAALNGAAGYLRGLLARRLQLRVAPKLRFQYDASVERGRQLDELIDSALAADRERLL